MKGEMKEKGPILNKGGAAFKLPSIQWHVPFFSFYQRTFMLLAVFVLFFSFTNSAVVNGIVIATSCTWVFRIDT